MDYPCGQGKDNSYLNHFELVPGWFSRPVHLTDARCNSSSAEVLMAFTGYGPTAPVGGNTLSTAEDKPLLYPPEKRDAAYLSGGFLSTYSWCSPVGWGQGKSH
ncbi:hypothetical protein AVEN_108498-1 [Araneus ventricosus]|uniref:Uncharacterized protein n=1 Tax=Araneus ventricosus TaxID=182803 RepID=A0A4Y2PJH7_ARAVE|nr:hypothetical protein AVEN_108498-1 [Araneus ventricosus]